MQQLQDEKARAPVTANKIEMSLIAFMMEYVIYGNSYYWNTPLLQAKITAAKKDRLITAYPCNSLIQMDLSYLTAISTTGAGCTCESGWELQDALSAQAAAAAIIKAIFIFFLKEIC